MSSYRESKFRIERSNLNVIAQLIRVLQIVNQSVEHVYMSQNKIAKSKLMNEASIIRHSNTIKNKIILKIFVKHVNIMKKQFEKEFKNVKR